MAPETPLRSAYFMPVRLLPTTILLASGPAAADHSEYCTDFFDEIAARYAATYTLRYDNTGVDSSFASAGPLLTAGEEGFVAMEIDPDAAATQPGTDPWTIGNGQALAVCVDGPWEPPAILMGSGAAVALAMPEWNRTDQATEIDGIQTFVYADRSAGVILHDAKLSESAVPLLEPSALLVLSDGAGTHEIRQLEIEGSITGPFSAVRQWLGAYATQFGGRVVLSGLDWEEVQDRSSLFRATCASDGDVEAPCPQETESDLDLTVENSTFVGVESITQAASFVHVVGDLTVSRTTLQDLSFLDPVLEATGNLRLDRGTSLINLLGPDGGVPALKAWGSFGANTTLMTDVDGWRSIAKANADLRIAQSYVCGISGTNQLLEAFTTQPARAEIVTTALVESRFFNGLVDASSAESLTSLLANLTLLDVQTPFDSSPEINLVKPPDAESNVLQVRNVLASESWFVAGPFLTADSERVALWNTSAEQNCSASGLASGCTELAAAPRFVGGDLWSSEGGGHSCAEEAADALAALLQAESREDQGEDRPDGVASLSDQTSALEERLPILLEGQDDLLGGGTSWSVAAEGFADCTALEGADIGAHNGTHSESCTLSFLAPASLDPSDTADTADGNADGSSGADSGNPDNKAGDDDGVPSSARFVGLGRGCRYGGAGALMLLPFAFASIRRQHRRAAAGKASPRAPLPR